MKYVYRGVDYDVTPVEVETLESSETGKYRGQTLKFTYPRHVPVPQPVHELKYRGVAYRTTSAGGTQSVPAIETVPAVPNMAPAVPNLAPMETSLNSIARARRRMLSEVGKVHRQNIQRSIEHRLEVARAKGDQLLVNQLEQEMQSLA